LSQPLGITGFLPMYKVKVLTGNQSEREKIISGLPELK